MTKNYALIASALSATCPAAVNVPEFILILLMNVPKYELHLYTNFPASSGICTPWLCVL